MFEFLSHRRIQQQLETIKERFPRMSQFQSFEEIPERLRVTPCIRAWMAVGGRGFESIPDQYLCDSIIFQGIYTKRLLGFDASKIKTSRYKQMLIFSAWCHRSGLLNIPVVYLTQDALMTLSGFKNFPLDGVIGKPLYECLFDSHLANAMITRSSRSLRLLEEYPDRFDIDPESVKACILASAFCYGDVERSGTMPILEDMLRDGFWPGEHEHLFEQSVQPGVDWGLRPTGPLQAFSSKKVVSRCDPNARSSVLPLFTALFNTYPKDQVMSELAGSQDGCDFLFELYPESEILSYAKQDRRLRGALLERDLGGFSPHPSNPSLSGRPFNRR